MFYEHIQCLEKALKEGNIDNIPVMPTLEAPPTTQVPPPPPPPPSLPLPPPPPPAPPGTHSTHPHTTRSHYSPVVPGPPPAPPLVNDHTSNIPEGIQLRRKGPKPSQALKSLNWKKLPDNKVTHNTVWKSINDSKVSYQYAYDYYMTITWYWLQIHAILNLKELEQTFSVYQPREDNAAAIEQRASRTSQIFDRPKELSVIEGRRAQNCTIMLSKIKMSNRQIREVHEQ